jgi:hypothetical protein
MKPFARDLPIAAQTTRPDGVAGIRPRDLLPKFDNRSPESGTCLDPDDLKLIAERWGTTYADNLISDPRWPTCRQDAAISNVEAILRTAIIDVAAILSAGADFKPHISMMAAATWCGFQNSMPSRGKSNAPIA